MKKFKIENMKDLKSSTVARSKGLQRRWLRNMVGIILALVLIFTAVFSISLSSSYYTTVEEQTVEKFEQFKFYLAFYCDLKGETELSRLFKAFEDGVTNIVFVDEDYNILVSGEEFEENTLADTKDVVTALEDRDLAVRRGYDPLFFERTIAVSDYIYLDQLDTTGVLRMTTKLSAVDEQISRFSILVLAMGCLLMIVVYAGGKYYVKSILEPISEITATAKRIAAGGYGVQIKRRSEDEIGELTETINNMSNNLAQSEKTQSEFMSSVSHELRTPLTAISGWSETLLDAGGSVEAAEARRGLNIILGESRRLTDMVEELLEFSRMQDGRFKLSVTMSDIRSEFEDTVFMYGSRLQQEEIKLEYLENDDEIPEIPCDASRMRQVFLNILDNGAKHGGEGGKITAEIRLEDPMVVIRIRDFGPGVPEEEIPLIKKKFYKGSSKARGSGIGLAVCEEIVSMHGGQLDISNAEGGGTLVTIRLPVGEA